MLLEIGSNVRMQLRSGVWVSNMTILAVANNLLTVRTSSGKQQTYDTVWDVVVIEKTSVISL